MSFFLLSSSVNFVFTYYRYKVWLLFIIPINYFHRNFYRSKLGNIGVIKIVYADLSSSWMYNAFWTLY